MNTTKKNYLRYRNLETAIIEFTEKNICLERESDEINSMGMSDNKESDEREHISNNDEVKGYGVIE